MGHPSSANNSMGGAGPPQRAPRTAGARAPSVPRPAGGPPRCAALLAGRRAALRCPAGGPPRCAALPCWRAAALGCAALHCSVRGKQVQPARRACRAAAGAHRPGPPPCRGRPRQRPAHPHGHHGAGDHPRDALALGHALPGRPGLRVRGARAPPALIVHASGHAVYLWEDGPGGEPARCGPLTSSTPPPPPPPAPAAGKRRPGTKPHPPACPARASQTCTRQARCQGPGPGHARPTTAQVRRAWHRGASARPPWMGGSGLGLRGGRATRGAAG
jgi:hypothetical protein